GVRGVGRDDLAPRAGGDLPDDASVGVADLRAVVRRWHHAVDRDRGVDQRHLERRDEELALAVRRVREERRLVERPRFRALAARGGKLDLWRGSDRSEEHTSELQSLRHLVCRLLLEKK